MFYKSERLPYVSTLEGVNNSVSDDAIHSRKSQTRWTMRNTLRTNNSKERIDGDSFHQRRKSVTSRGGALKKFDKETKLNRVSSSRNKKGGALGTLKNLIAKKALKDLIKEPIYSKRGPQREEMSSVVSFEAKNIVTELFNKGMHRKISFKPKFGKREIKLAKDEARELDRISPNPNVAEAMCKTYREGLIKRVRSLSVPDRSYQEKRIFRRKRSVQNKSTTEGGYIENALMQERQEKISHQILNTKAKLKYFTKERNKSFLKREIEIHNLTENRVKRHKLLDIGSGNSEIINNSKNKRNLNDLKSLQVDIRLKQLEEIEQMRLAQIRTGVQFKQMIREIKESFMKMANMKLNLVYVNPTKIEFVDPDAIEIPTTQRTDSNDREEKEKSIQDQLDLMDEMRFREKQLVLEEIIRENRFNWIPNIAFIDLFKKCLSSKEMYNLHFNEQELFRLYSILIHLPIFRSYTQKEILEIFYSSTIREIPKSTQEFYKGYLGIYIILRGSLVAGNKRLLTKGGLHQDYPIEDLEITPELNSEEPTNMYFELSDGSYITSNIFKFFPKREGPYTQRIKLEFTETTTLMQIKVNDISRPIIERHQHYDFYKRLDYLSNHKGFAKLGFFTLLKLAREIVTIKKDYGTSIFKVGQESPGLYIIREGSVSV